MSLDLPVAVKLCEEEKFAEDIPILQLQLAGRFRGSDPHRDVGVIKTIQVGREQPSSHDTCRTGEQYGKDYTV